MAVRSRLSFDGSFPTVYGRTMQFRLGAPSRVRVSGDGARVFFLRSLGPEQWEQCLWAYEVATGEERLLADPSKLLLRRSESTPRVELSRRERVREPALGIVDYAMDRVGQVVTFSLDGRLFCLQGSTVTEVMVPGPVIDPKPAPSGRAIAYSDGHRLWLVSTAGEALWCLADSDANVIWGLAEHVAAEEMGRHSGYWWSPTDDHLLVTRVDLGGVTKIFIGDPAHPWSEPLEQRYPFAGTTNATVDLYDVNEEGYTTKIALPDNEPYLVACSWPAVGPPLVVTQTRDHKRVTVSEVDAGGGRARPVSVYKGDYWVDVPPGIPQRLSDGRLVWAGAHDGWTRLWVGGEPKTPARLEIREVAAVSDDTIWLLASADPTEIHVYRWRAESLEQVTFGAGVYGISVGGATNVVRARTMNDSAVRTTVSVSDSYEHVLTSLATPFPEGPQVQFMALGEQKLRVGVVLPSADGATCPLPILMDPYGGAAQRVLAAADMWLVPKWFAAQGFAVVVADGRGSPGRGPDWERSLYGDVGTAPLEDQLAALEGVTAAVPGLDLSRVAIRGWSFGGYLAALAVLRRPDVFHAAIVGAPVTDWRLYDTYATERWLGDPAVFPGHYTRSSLLDKAESLSRPILLTHGLADDNVLVVHSIQLSERLLAAGRPHSFVPLAGVTHMAAQASVAEQRLRRELRFLQDVFSIQVEHG